MARRALLPPQIPQTQSRNVDNVDITHSGDWQQFAGRHNRRRDGSLKPAVRRAIEIASAANPRLAGLAERLIPKLPFRVQSSDTIKSHVREPFSIYEPIIYAIERERISLNTDDWVNAVIIDCDHGDIDRWRLCGLPTPSWITASPHSYTHHVGWVLSRPVYVGANAALGPVDYLARVRQAVTHELGGDHSYSHRLTKNPWHPGWITPALDGQPVELGDLYAAVACADGRIGRRDRRVEDNGLGRNSTLFDRTRFWAYDRAEMDFGAILDHAIECNDFSPPLPPKEVHHTARSIWRFMTKRWRGRGSGRNIDRGVMALPDDMPLVEKQQAAAVRSAAENRRGKDTAIEAAIAQLRAAGRPITATAVVEAAEGAVSLRTVKGRLAAMRRAAHPAPAVPAPLPALKVIQGSRQAARSTSSTRAYEYARVILAAGAARRAEAGSTSNRPAAPVFSLPAGRRQSG